MNLLMVVLGAWSIDAWCGVIRYYRWEWCFYYWWRRKRSVVTTAGSVGYIDFTNLETDVFKDVEIVDIKKDDLVLTKTQASSVSTVIGDGDDYLIIEGDSDSEETIDLSHINSITDAKIKIDASDESVDKITGTVSDDIIVIEDNDIYIDGGDGTDTLVIDNDVDLSGDDVLKNVEKVDAAGNLTIDYDDLRRYNRI